MTYNLHAQAELEQLGFRPMQDDEGDFTFVCVPEQAVREALANAPSASLWVVRSTMAAGDTVALTTEFRHHIVHLPEFLRAATALPDALSPNYMLIGECCPEHGSQIQQLFGPLMCPIQRVDPITSELLKLVANAHPATLISFWNQVYLLCETIGVNSTIVGKIASQDPCISSYGAVMHGKPFDGRCLPKDLNAIIDFANRQHADPVLLEAVRAINERLAQITPARLFAEEA